MIRIMVDRSVCAGHALCAARAPGVYRLDDEGYCSSDGELVSPQLEEQARLGARHCPESAILLVDEPAAPDAGA
jgi:ferredoxin